MTHTAEPLVSILVPACNSEATLAETLQSALASSYSRIEVVLVDDGSIDATVAIAEGFARHDERVRLFRQQHRGVSAALNFGLGQVRGDLVARLDADDLWHPTKLEKQVELLLADPAVALVYTFVRYVDGSSGRIVRDAAPQELAARALCQCLYNGIVGGGSSVVFRRSVLDSVGGFDESLAVWEDLLLHLKVAAVGAIGFVPEYLTGYRRRQNSSSADLNRSLANWRRARKRVETEFPQVPPFVHRWSHARRLLELAEGFAFDRRYQTSAKLLAECLSHDPVRTSVLVAYRLGRRLSGNRRPLHRSGPLFADADPTATYCVSEFDSGLEGHRLRALDETRQAVLRAIDRDLIQPPRSADDAGNCPQAEAGP